MSKFTLKTIVITLLLTFVQQLQAEGFRRGTIYIQPAIAEAVDDSLQLRKRIKKDMIFAKHIYSQIGITVKTRKIIVLNKVLSMKSAKKKGERITVGDFLSEKLENIDLATIIQAKKNVIPVIYVPPIRYLDPKKGAGVVGEAKQGTTVISKASFVSIWLPTFGFYSTQPSHDTPAHEVMHFLLGEGHSFEKHSFIDSKGEKNLGHSNIKTDLMYPGASRPHNNNLNETAPFGNLSQIRNLEMLINGNKTKLFDALFEDNKFVYVEYCEQCSVSLDSGRILYQYPSWLPEPETLIKVYTESLSANGKIELKTDEGNQAKSKPKSTVPIVLRYTDLGQETKNSGGGVLGAQIQSKEPVVFNEPISEMSASITIEDMTNFSNSQAKGVIVLKANISPSIFSRTHALEKSAIDRTARALQNNGRHELEITFSDLRLALPETLKDFSIVASGRGISKEGIEYEVFPDPASGPDRMAIKLRIKQQVGTNKPDLGKLSLRINSKFLITKGAIPSDQLLNLFKAWYFK